MHIAEKRLELFALNPGRFSDNEKVEIESHLEECKWCSEAYERMLETYRNFAEEEASQAESRVRGRLENQLPILQSTRGEAVQTASETKPVRHIGFIIDQVRRHPVTSASSVALAALLVVALLNWAGLLTSANPSQAVARDGFLRVYDDKGRELWARFIDQDYSLADTISWEGTRRVLSVRDVNGDGRNEVLAIMGWKASLREPNAMMCFNPDGSLLWDYRLHRSITFGSITYTDDYACYLLLVGDFDCDGKEDLLAVAHHAQWEPGVLLLFDAATGDLRSEYWHFGHIAQVLNSDLDGDGVDEIIAGADNSEHKLASIVVLDPRVVKGCAPISPERQPKDLAPGTEEYYILFPRSDLSTASAEYMPALGPLEMTARGTLSVVSTESIGSYAYGLIFEFDKAMRCIAVRPANNFLGIHEKLERERILKERVDSLYVEKLREGVRYWDGERFVKEAVMNKVYRKISRR